VKKYDPNKNAVKKVCGRKGCDNTFFPLFKGETITRCHICRHLIPSQEAKLA